MDAVVYIDREPEFRLDGATVSIEIRSGQARFCYVMPVSVLRATVKQANRILDQAAETARRKVVPIKRG